jgi:hypothetical protein
LSHINKKGTFSFYHADDDDDDNAICAKKNGLIWMVKLLSWWGTFFVIPKMLYILSPAKYKICGATISDGCDGLIRSYREVTVLVGGFDVEMFFATKTGQVWLHEIFMSTEILDIDTLDACFRIAIGKSFYELFCNIPLE